MTNIDYFTNLRGYIVAYVEGADQAYWRIHATNMTAARSPFIDLAQRLDAFRSIFADYGSAFPYAQELSRVARREIAQEALWRARRADDKGRLLETPVAQLKQLAYDTYREVHTLPDQWGLRWCELIGPRMAQYLQLFILASVYRRVRKMLWLRRWRLKGY